MYFCDWCGSLDPSDDGELYKLCRICDGNPCTSCEEIIRLNLQIADAKEKLEILLHKRREIKLERNNKHDLMKNLLPMEIVIHIFELCVAPDPDYYELYSPMTLAAVCQHWRKFIESRPSLWKYIQLFLSKSTSNFNLHVLTKHIACSGQLPLSIEIRLLKEASEEDDEEDVEEEEDENDEDEDGYQYDIYGSNGRGNGDESDEENDTELLSTPIIEALSSCSHRWEVFNCDITKRVWKRLRRRVDSALGTACLKTLRLCSWGWTPHGLRTFLTHAEPMFISEATTVSKPRPTSVGLSHMTPEYLNIDWSGVKHITDSVVPLDITFDLFDLAHKMVDCTIHVDIIRKRLQNFKVHTYPVLTSLHIYFQKYPELASHFFRLMNLPSLRDIIVDMEERELPIGDLNEFLQRASRCLRTITLDNIAGESDNSISKNLISLFKSVPLLEELTINTMPTRYDPEASRPMARKKPLLCIKIVDYFTQRGARHLLNRGRDLLLKRKREGMVIDLYRHKLDLLSGMVNKF
ncbi:hypothetical protein CPB84DRAFT_1776274 [Gymnopilus junonius]|uniref:F-box domain-containing protein n=1 Tax=Gymnopilus junonius TaxID=109634 RepID=A0A9P5TNX5_GYMJU|nr:hypothetical protein CPB84DRAFT_1776274 [Gymnopilus junonius]